MQDSLRVPAILAAWIILAAGPALAREFDSSLNLKVFVRGSGEMADRVIGTTPADRGHPIEVPDESLWYVRPVGGLSAIQLSDLARLMQTQNVPGLDLSDHAELTSESVLHLSSVSGLRMLNLSRTRVDNRGLSALAGMAKLESLDLSGTAVDDEGLSVLPGFPLLRRVVLGGLVTDACAPHLQALQSLEEIDIAQTRIGEKGLSALARLGKLKTIYLNGQVTDAGLTQLSSSRSARVLDVRRAGITDDDLKRLAKLKQFRTIILNGAPSPAAAVMAPPNLGAPSPWEAAAGSEQARLPSVPQIDPLAAPVSIAGSGNPAELRPELPKPSVALIMPSQSVGIASGGTVSSDQPGSPKAAADFRRVIALQSNPSRRGGIAGLSGLKPPRPTPAQDSLDSVAGPTPGPAVSVQDDKPENFLGEINVQGK